MALVVRTGLVAGAVLAANLAVANPAGNSPPPAVVTSTCQTCHGATGDSTSPTVPRLNGQHAEYLTQRLADFHHPGSQDPHATEAMWGIVRQVSDQTLADVAKYFAAQTPTEPKGGGGALADAGRKLYMNGDPSSYVPACQTCHGANGEGRGAYPRLAGQHATYLQNQLERLRLGLRASEVMHPNTNSMTDAQIKALVAYLARD